MNVAVANAYRRRGIASALLERLFDVTATDPKRGYTLEVRVSNTGAITALRAARLRGTRCSSRLLHRQPRGRAHHVARADAVRAGVVILGIETSCDETAAAVVTDDGRVLSSVVSSQADLHARFGGVVPEVASRRHLELVSPVVRTALESAGEPIARVERVAVTQGPGLVGALLVGISAAKAIAWATPCAARPGRPPGGPRRIALPRARPAGAAVHVPARERRPHAAPRRARARALGTARHDARRRRG